MTEIEQIAANLTKAQREAWDRAIKDATEGRECQRPIYPPLTAAGERLDSTFETHCRHLMGRPKERAVAKPDPADFAGRLRGEQRAYVLALPQHKLSRWGTKVRLAVRDYLKQQETSDDRQRPRPCPNSRSTSRTGSNDGEQ
jgi:hypothetical protein